MSLNINILDSIVVTRKKTMDRKCIPVFTLHHTRLATRLHALIEPA